VSKKTNNPRNGAKKMATSKIDGKGNERIECLECGGWYHSLAVHLRAKHGILTEEYDRRHPGAPIFSDYGKGKLVDGKRNGGKKGKAPAPASTPVVTVSGSGEPAKTPTTPEHLYFGESKLPVMIDLSEADSAIVPEHDPNYKFWNKEALESTALAIELDMNLLLVGPTGCGKTSMVEELASLCNQPTTRVNLDGDVRSSDFLGQMNLVVDPVTSQTVTKWTDGVLPAAMRNGYWLILDEMDAAPASILMTIQAVLESGHKLTLKENSGELIKAHPNFRIIATANTLGRGDESGLYVGTNVLNEATLDRFGIVIEYSYPNVKQEASIIKAKTGIDTETARAMCSVAKKIRDGADNDECNCTFSTRRILNWATLSVKLSDTARGARLAVLGRLGSDDRAYVRGVMQRVLGGDF
jgi:cobaltochelatase CobS